MRELETIVAAGDRPATVGSLVHDLRELGLEAGMVVLAHVSLSSLGWVCGGPGALLQAMIEVLGGDGTLVMPAMSPELSEPSRWRNPPVPRSWWETIRSCMPAFQADMTPARGMGVVAETFRSWRGTLRSEHPQASFTARGPLAGRITAGHRLACGLGEDSPLARVYDLDGRVLLLGVGYERCTSFHLAEYRAEFPSKKLIPHGAPVVEQGERVWREYEDLDLDESDFPLIGQEIERRCPGMVRAGRVGIARARLFPQRGAVDLAVELMDRLRG